MSWDKDIGLLVIDILMLSICILMYKKKTILGTYGKYMFAAMVVSFVIDVIIYYIGIQKNIPGISSLYIYIYGQTGVFFMLLFLMYQNLIKDKKLQKIAKLILISFVIFFLFQIYQLDISIKLLQNILYFDVFLLLFAITLFLLDTFKTDIILNLKNYYPFWFSLGLIIIYLAIIPSIIISSSPKSIKNNELWSIIIFFVNFIGYGIIFVGLFTAKKLD
ncbi:hypothetical protein [Frigoriflavimonas asaccharolytica]|uniref:Uncharacterized protein n=1 Tax=Frigoriflavimonas asaccharolytica TaxID=2735899 RepID=A0A8J8G692_9FLAO|nr:hypothetical protein [Frigoriflavimonas asaccharolytica]